MAELRRADGSMEPHKQLGHRKILLPFEQELCQQLGISEEEYFEFLRYTSSLNGNRPKEYDNIPYVINGPIGALFSAAFAGNFAAQLVIGLIFTAIAYFLTPKPKPPKTPPSLTTAGQQGVRRFAPQTGFDSAQELAELGAVIPLVFSKFHRIEDKQFGGVRVNTQLLWSQMRSLGKGQQIKAIFNLSSGELGQSPDFNGYAIGDILLKNYSEGKFRLFWYNGSPDGDGKFRVGPNKYPQGNLERELARNGHFSSDGIELPLIDSDRAKAFVSNMFCGTRTPSTQNIFGNYNPVPNSMRFMLPYELVLVQNNLDGAIKDKTFIKRQKVQTNFPRYQAIISVKRGNTELNPDNNENLDVSKNDLVTYQISDQDPNEEFDFSDWGAEDVTSSINADRENTDDTLAIGEQYLVGTAIGILISHDSGIWEKGKVKNFKFKIIESGKVQVKPVGLAHNPFETLLIQKCAIGVITNSYKCDATEIGLKSIVNKQITGFANVNSHPGYWEYYDGGPEELGVNSAGELAEDGVVHDYEKKDGNISLGQMSKYVKRYSFFKLYARTVGEDTWTHIGEKPFAVLGRTPQPQYNFIRITHSNAELREFKLEPYPGNKIKEEFVGKSINLLTGTTLASIPQEGEYQVFFNGESDYQLTPNRASNPEWFLGEIPLATEAEKGQVLAFDRNIVGTIPVIEEFIVEYNRYESHNDEDEADFKVKTKQIRARHGGGTSFTFIAGGEVGRTSVKERQGGVPRFANREDIAVFKDGFRYHVGEGVTDSDDDFIEEYFIVKSRQVVPPVTMSSGYPKNLTMNNGITDVTPSKGSGESGSGLELKVEQYTDGAKRWTIENRGTGYEEGDVLKIDFDDGDNQIVICSVELGQFVTEPWPEGQNLNPFDAIADYIKFDAERPSHLDQPEHQITYVNEMINNQEMLYTNLSNVGLIMNSSKEFQSFSQLSVYVKNGIKIKNLANNGTIESSNLFPNIAFHLLTDQVNGAGNLIGETQINEEDMITAAKFCEANRFFWDGAITQQQNIREFIYQNAAFCLLDFTIKGGQFSLVPTLPFKDNFEINRGVNANELPKALFTDGNTRNLKVSFLSPEERQLFQARVLYREEVENGFPETKVLDIRFKGKDTEEDENLEKDPREIFDMSNFCTSVDHAKVFAKYALMVRKFVDHGISFETIPDAGMALQPGDYIRVFSEITHNDRFENGFISADGVIQSQGSTNPVGKKIFYWKAFEEINGELEEFGNPKAARLTVNENGRATGTFRGAVFTIEKTTSTDRIYRVESITYTEEGFVQITGTHQPVTSTGTLRTLDYAGIQFAEN